MQEKRKHGRIRKIGLIKKLFMILHTLYSESHKVLFEKYFRPSIKDTDLCFIFDEVPQEAEGTFLKDGWHTAMIRKFKLCEQLSSGGEQFIHSDSDVQFFKPVRNIAEEALKNVDLVFQHDGDKHLCAGLFCANPSPRVSELFKVAQEVIRDRNIESQQALNLLLRTKDLPYDFSDIKYGYFPSTWWTHGAETMKVWDGEDINPPIGIVAHHANWVYGVDAKIKLLEKVRTIVNSRLTLAEF